MPTQPIRLTGALGALAPACSVTVVPEPGATAALAALGLAGFAFSCRRNAAPQA